MIRRCRWCLWRIGTERYQMGSEWITLSLVPEHRVTDGICEECFVIEQSKILSVEGARCAEQGGNARNVAREVSMIRQEHQTTIDDTAFIAVSRPDDVPNQRDSRLRTRFCRLFNFHARLGLGQVAPLADGSCVAHQVGRQPLLSAALVRVLQFISRRRWSSSGRRRFFIFNRSNRRGLRLGKYLALSHPKWGLKR